MTDDRGQSLVEFALASVVFFMTVFVIMEFGLAVWRYNMVADLAQEGARWAAVRGVNGTIQASDADVRTFVQGRATAHGLNVDVSTTPAPGTLIQGSRFTVTVTSNYTSLTGFTPRSLLTLTSQAQMVIAR